MSLPTKKTTLPQFAKQVLNSKREPIFECVICAEQSKTIALFQRHILEERHSSALHKALEAAKKKKEDQQQSLKRPALEDPVSLREQLEQEEEIAKSIERMNEFRREKEECERELQNSLLKLKDIEEKQLEEQQENDTEETKKQVVEENAEGQNVPVDDKQDIQQEEGVEEELNYQELCEFKKDMAKDTAEEEFANARSLIEKMKARKKKSRNA